MVFFVDHQARGFIVADVETALRLGGDEVRRSEVPLDQVLAPRFGKLLVLEELAVLQVAGIGKRPAHDFNCTLVVARLRPVGERYVGQVAGEPDAGGEYYVGFRPGGREPFANNAAGGVHARNSGLVVK